VPNVLFLNIVGLTPELLAHAPRLSALGTPAPLTPPLPAVTSTCEATMLTGTAPRDHGVVANGWFHRDLNEVRFWSPCNRLVSGRKVWEDVTGDTAVMFWRFNMATDAAISVAERPAYPADGRKIPDLYTNPPELGVELQNAHGRFPLFNFWGPTSGIESTRWIVNAARDVIAKHRPTLALVYLPHLDYDLQRFGPNDARIAEQVRAVDAEAGRLMDAAPDYKVLVASEYGITKVTGAVMINRALRQAGLLDVQRNVTGEVLDPFRSRAFAVCDHQLAHVYVRNPKDLAAARKVIETLDGVDRILDKAATGLDHERSGELVVLSAKDRWFAYPYWLDDGAAPDFARTVDIHRKPGYDPCELFFDKRVSKASVAWTLLKKKLGFRTLFEVVPLDPSVVGGSHGRLPDSPAEGPILLGDDDRPRDMTEIRATILRHVNG